MTNSTTNTTIHSNVVPSEVGWQFVPQYYTFVNKQPDYLHRFYTKKSTFVHGTEGEDGKPCHGQQEIHAKIQSLGFQDCKVFIHSVDAQSSADGGIIIQVIGEMSNRGEDWRKFVQTFFLAEQPNGYFVLNDIFRFLKEETVEGDEGEAEPVNVPAMSVPAPPPPAPEPASVVTTTSTDIPQEAPAVPAPVVSMSSASPVPPQFDEPPAPVAEPPVEAPSPVPEQAPLASPSPVPAVEATINGHIQEPEAPAPPPPAVAPVAPTEKSRSPAPPPAANAAPSSSTPAPAPLAPTPQAPPQPKTWANLAAANSKKWGAAVSSESRGMTEVIPSSAPGSGTQTPVGSGPASSTGPVPKSPHPGAQAVQSITTAHVFIKGVMESISQTMLNNHLTQNFGPLKELDIVRSKYCAFGEFQSVEAARKAIITCLPQSQGGQGGIWIEVANGETVRIVVDTRKERNDRPVGRPRGGAPQGTGEGRGGGMAGGNVGGSFRGRGGRGGGRGGGPK